MALNINQILFDNLTTAQRDALASPKEGTVIYNTDNDRIEVNIGTEISPVWTEAGGGHPVDSVNGKTGIVVLNPDDLDDASSAHKFVTASDVTKLGNISVTQAVDLDTIESDVATNNGKVTNATHTGEVTGSGALTVDPTAVSNKTLKSTLAGTEEVLINDGGALKKTTTQDIADLGGGGGGLQNKSGHKTAASFAGDPKTVAVTFSTAFADTNYSVNTTAVVSVSNKSYVTQVLNKTTSGFTITLGTGSVDELVGVDWTATKHGES